MNPTGSCTLFMPGIILITRLIETLTFCICFKSLKSNFALMTFFCSSPFWASDYQDAALTIYSVVLLRRRLDFGGGSVSCLGGVCRLHRQGNGLPPHLLCVDELVNGLLLNSTWNEISYVLLLLLLIRWCLVNHGSCTADLLLSGFVCSSHEI